MATPEMPEMLTWAPLVPSRKSRSSEDRLVVAREPGGQPAFDVGEIERLVAFVAVALRTSVPGQRRHEDLGHDVG